MSFDLIESYRSKRDILIKLKRKKSDIEQWKSNIGTFDYCLLCKCLWIDKRRLVGLEKEIIFQFMHRRARILALSTPPAHARQETRDYRVSAKIDSLSTY
jgi:hypothetical protein